MGNLDLFADDHEAIGQLADNLGKIPTAELRSKWPAFLSELVDVMACELDRQGVTAADDHARKLAFVVSHYMGGRAIYLPTGQKLKAALRDREIFDKWVNGTALDQLIDDYELSAPKLYELLAEQRKLYRKRHQPDMFDSE
jgi:Mor family transcriptional regulator